MDAELTIQRGFPEELRLAAAALYDVAFGAKLSIAIPAAAQRLAVLARGIEPSFAFTAVRNDQLAGIAGFKTAAGSFTGGVTAGLLQEVLGPFGAVRALAILALFERKFTPGQLLMDGIAVAPEQRGVGVGTRLLQSLIDYARREGYGSLRLDVIDTNPAARRLYERVGFTPTATDHFPYLQWLLGFGAATQMQYMLNDTV